MSLWKSLYNKIKCQKHYVSEHTQKFTKFLRKPIEWIEIEMPSLKFNKEEIISGKSKEEE